MLIYKIIRKINTLYLKYKVKYENQLIVEQIKKEGGQVGKNFSVGNNVTISGCKNIEIGNNVSIGSNSFIRGEGGLKIGNNVIISRNLVLYTNSHNYHGKRLPFDETYINSPVVIEDNSWIGMNVTISPRTVIGEGSIIALGSRIYGNIPKLSIIGSSMPKIITSRDPSHYQDLVKDKKYGNKDGKKYE